MSGYRMKTATKRGMSFIHLLLLFKGFINRYIRLLNRILGKLSITYCCCFNIIIGINSGQKRRQMGLPVSDSVRAAICDCNLKDTRMKAQLFRRVPVVHTDSQMPSGIFVLKVACCSKELAPGEFMHSV